MNPTGRLTAALAGRYTIERELGQGGMATVYLAEDVRHRRKVALKVLRPELAAVIGAERFLKEIETTANLQHPHILPLHDSGELNGTAFYVMPYVQGESLRERLQREKQLPIDVALRITKEIASALDYAHRHGVIHRDIKPENVLLHDGQALVADFGIALAAARTGDTRMTETGMSLGTPQYMSPEQAMGERALDARTDIYALGCVLYEMLTGEPPFTGPTAQAIVAKVMTEKPAPILPRRSRVPPHVEDAIFVALDKLPADRFASAAQFSDALEAKAGVAAQRPAAARSRHALLMWTGWGVALVVAASAAWIWSQRATTAAPSRLARRVTIQIPLITDFRGSRPNIALSSDGSIIVHGVFRGSSAAMHYRRMGQLHSQPILGTEGGDGPFLSPDAGKLGFLKDAAMYVVPLTGGSAELVKGAFASVEGSPGWLSDGRIVYTNERGGLVITTADGSRSDTLTRPAAPERHISPLMLPGNRTVLFMNVSADINQSRIEAFDMSTRQRSVLIADGAMTPQYSDGFLFFAKADGADASLHAVALDPKTARVRGEVISLGDVINRSRFGTARYAVAQGVLLYSESSNTFLVEVDRRGGTTRLVDQNGSWHHPRYSPDGNRIVLDIAQAAGRDVWVFDRATKTLSRVTRLGDAHDPAWLPNGREVSFFSFKLGGLPLRIAAADGGSEPRSIDFPGGFVPTDLVNPGAWLPDGKAYVGSVDDGGSPGDIWVVPIDGSKPQRVVASPFEEFSPSVSPDGRWLAYQSNETGRAEVYVRSLFDAGSRMQVSNAGGVGPVWDRRRPVLYYIRFEDRQLRLEAVTLRTAPLGVTQREIVLSDVGVELSDNHANFDVHPSGDRFVFPQEQNSSAVVAIFDWAAALERARNGK